MKDGHRPAAVACAAPHTPRAKPRPAVPVTVQGHGGSQRRRRQTSPPPETDKGSAHEKRGLATIHRCREHEPALNAAIPTTIHTVPQCGTGSIPPSESQRAARARAEQSTASPHRSDSSVVAGNREDQNFTAVRFQQDVLHIERHRSKEDGHDQPRSHLCFVGEVGPSIAERRTRSIPLLLWLIGESFSCFQRAMMLKIKVITAAP